MLAIKISKELYLMTIKPETGFDGDLSDDNHLCNSRLGKAINEINEVDRAVLEIKHSRLMIALAEK